MADEVKRWTVTYTKHIKQKRKVYQDGYILLESNKKVKLYDDTDKMLDGKFLKEDENLSSGESLTFGSYLVDIGDSESAGLAQAEKITKHSDKNCTPARQKVLGINMSPSRRIFREFKKNEKIKSALQEKSPSPISSIVGEWQALYTTHLTQKPKKYHDGFIKLILCGSQGRQAKLYDESKTLLDSRFLKKDDVIRSGESLKLDGYLIDIGDPVNGENSVNVEVEGQNCNTPEKQTAVERNRFQHSSSNNQVSSLKKRKFSQSFVTAHKLFKKGNASHDACSGKDVDQRLNRSSFAADTAGLAERGAPNMSLPCYDGVSSLKNRNLSQCFVAADKLLVKDRVVVTQSGAPNTVTAHKLFEKGNPPPDASSKKDVEQKLNSHGVAADKVVSQAPNISLRGAHQILSSLKKPTSPRRNFVSEHAPEKQCYPSPDLVILDADSEERFQGRDLDQLRRQSSLKKRISPRRSSVTEQGAEDLIHPSSNFVVLDADYDEMFQGNIQQDSDQLKKQGTQEGEDKFTQYGGITQPNSNPFHIFREIKKEKDCDDDVSVLRRSSTADVISSIEKPTQSRQGLDKVVATNTTCSSQPCISSNLVDLEKPQPVELLASQGVSYSEDNHFPTNTQSGDAYQHCKTYSKADTRCNEVGVEKRKSVSHAFGIRHYVKMNSSGIRSSTTMGDYPSFDLGV